MISEDVQFINQGTSEVFFFPHQISEDNQLALIFSNSLQLFYRHFSEVTGGVTMSGFLVC